ncbi:MAG TPA: hypothetical protein VK736_12875 [Candidatus Binatia bacterium]|nr:hypothetical protein [Candidatus Binatia bacterium]
MNRRSGTLSIALALALAVASAGAVHASAPVRDGDSYTVTFYDDFIFELCGIDTFTTLTERWAFKEFADGSTILHVNRTFVSDDPRIPVEKGAGSSHTAPDGTRTVVGKPTQLFDPDGGIRLLDAGLAIFDEFGDVLKIRGHGESLTADTLAPYYCPQD